MAVDVSICADSDSDNLFVFDTTRDQSGYNQSGWGPPNKRVTDIDSALLEIWTPKTGLEGSPIEIDPYPAMPNKEGIGYRIHPDMLNMEQIESGIYRIRFSVKDEDDLDEQGNAWKGVANYYLLSTCLVGCCISKMSQETSILEDDKASEMERLLQSAERSAKVGQMAEAQKVISYLNEQCRC